MPFGMAQHADVVWSVRPYCTLRCWSPSPSIGLLHSGPRSVTLPGPGLMQVLTGSPMPDRLAWTVSACLRCHIQPQRSRHGRVCRRFCFLMYLINGSVTWADLPGRPTWSSHRSLNLFMPTPRLISRLPIPWLWEATPTGLIFTRTVWARGNEGDDAEIVCVRSP